MSNLGIIYGKMGLLDQAIQQLRRSLDISPRDPITMFNLALAYEQRAESIEQRAESVEQRAEGKELRVKAVRTYRKLLLIKPGHLQARERIQRLRAED